MSKPSLILFGAGGHAHACLDVIEQHGQYQVAGLVGTPEEMHTQHLGYAVIATDHDVLELAKTYQHAIVAVGQILSPDQRIRLYEKATQVGFRLPVIISPSAHVSRHATIGAGTIVMHGAIVNAGARVGRNCIINTRALVEHGAAVEDHCHVSTGAILNGDVHVGAGSYVGSGSILREGVSLGRGCVVGMGLSVRHSQVDNVKFVRSDQI